MKLLKRRIVLAPLLILILGTSALMAAPKPQAIIIVQPNSPIEIISYSADFHERSTVFTEGIDHALQYKNRGTQKVVAISFGVLSFDVFNRFLATSAGISMRDLVLGKTERSSWVQNPYAAFSFLTGLAYVNLVRFEDGTLWQADEATVLAEIRKIEKDFDAKLLKEKEVPGR